jgi:hypothetical protein
MLTGNQIASRLKRRVLALSLLSLIELVQSPGLAVEGTWEKG